MPILGTRPVQVAKIDAKTFDIYWMQSLQIHAPNPLEIVKASFTLVPQSSETNEIYQEGKIRVNLDDVMGLVQSDQAVQEAFVAILAAVQKLAKDRNLI